MTGRTVTAYELEAARARIRGHDPTVVVDAAAGCGKTHEAVDATVEFAAKVGDGREVLLLTHTNAARDVYAGRLHAVGGRARTQTLDSLACEVVGRYARHFELPEPFRPGATHAGHPSFPEVQRRACELLHDAPAVAEGLAWRHPIIIVDEHQDSSAAQHEFVERIGAAGRVRRRYFGDGMQRIFEFSGAGDAWTRLTREHEPVPLSHGHRWNDNPELRDWLAAARAALKAGRSVALSGRPACVTVRRWKGDPPGPRQKGHCPELLTQLNHVALAGRAVVLVRDGRHGYALAEKLPHKLALYEGADAKSPSEWLERALGSEGDPARLSGLLAELLSAWGAGVPKSRVSELKAVCTTGGVELGRRTRIKALVELCRPLYKEPTAATWLRAFQNAVTDHASLGWRIIRRYPAWLLAAVPAEAEDLLLALQATAEARTQTVRPPSAAVMTVHRAKGSECDTVALPYACASSFGDDEESARLLYVALTRAQRAVHLFLSEDDPCPWFR
jgi:DNA helicase-2/ATP-dependent DNA helicase PcrA